MREMIEIKDGRMSRSLESKIYAGIWCVVGVVYVVGIMRARSYSGLPMLDFRVVGHIACTLIPFLFLFLVNNALLIPRLLATNRYGRYLSLTLGLVLIVWLLQGGYFFYEITRHELPQHIKMHPGPRPLLPWPLFMELICDALIVGVNLAIALLFQRFHDRLEHERLLKSNAESQLSYLKAQINPHFYMNMLNNIHGMIEIDPEKAQEMVIEMSRLMRYTLYDSSKPHIALRQEIEFLRDYMGLMRQRYPRDKVRISKEFPDDDSISGVMIPPLLFLVFIENSFKHGVSYSTDSFITVKLEIAEGRLTFRCLNSVHGTEGVKTGSKGIGLQNVSQRLDLIYGNAYSLEVHDTERTYLVTLTIPTDETKNIDN